MCVPNSGMKARKPSEQETQLFSSTLTPASSLHPPHNTPVKGITQDILLTQDFALTYVFYTMERPGETLHNMQVNICKPGTEFSDIIIESPGYSYIVDGRSLDPFSHTLYALYW